MGICCAWFFGLAMALPMPGPNSGFANEGSAHKRLGDALAAKPAPLKKWLNVVDVVNRVTSNETRCLANGNSYMTFDDWSASRRSGGQESVLFGEGSVGFYAWEVTTLMHLKVVGDSDIEMDVQVKMTEEIPNAEGECRTHRERSAKVKKIVGIGKTLSLKLNEIKGLKENVEVRIRVEHFK